MRTWQLRSCTYIAVLTKLSKSTTVILNNLKSVESYPALHQVSAFPSADGLKEKRALTPKCQETNGHLCTCPTIKTVLPLHFCLWILYNAAETLPVMANKRPSVLFWFLFLFFLLLTLYNVVNACIQPFSVCTWKYHWRQLLSRWIPLPSSPPTAVGKLVMDWSWSWIPRSVQFKSVLY